MAGAEIADSQEEDESPRFMQVNDQTENEQEESPFKKDLAEDQEMVDEAEDKPEESQEEDQVQG